MHGIRAVRGRVPWLEEVVTRQVLDAMPDEPGSIAAEERRGRRSRTHGGAELVLGEVVESVEGKAQREYDPNSTPCIDLKCYIYIVT